jgi:Signal transduction histidine kinase
MGVLRFSGENYHIYQLPYVNVDLYKVRLVYTNYGLVAYTNNGQIFRYNRINDRFDLVLNLYRVNNNFFPNVSNVIVDETGCFWISTTNGFFKYQRGRLTLVDGLGDAFYTTWYDVNYFFVASSKGVWLFNKNTRKRIWLYQNNSKFDFNVSRLFWDRKTNKLWIGTFSSGLYLYDFKRHNLSAILNGALPKQPVLAIEVNSDSSVLVGIDGQGIWEVERSGRKIQNVYKEDNDDPSSLRGNGVYDIINDQNKRIWVCTYSGGISYFDKTVTPVTQITHTINDPGSLANNNVNKIIQDRRGNIWVATDNGISCLDAATGRWRTFYQNKHEHARVFLSICEDNQGRIWAGTYSSGVYVLDSKTGQELAHYTKDATKNSLESAFVLDIYKDKANDLWIGGIRGKLIRYIAAENKFQTYPPQPINAISELSPNQLLLACSYGLTLFDKNTGASRILLIGYMIQDMVVINDDIWFCTSGEGLIKYNHKTGQKHSVTTKSGLPSNYVNSVMYSDGYLWLGTESGLCRLNPMNMEVLTFNSIISLSHPSFNWNSHCKLKNGDLMWGTNNGIIRFSPASVTEVKSKGSVFFQELTLAGHSIRGSLDTPLDSLRELSLNYNQNTLNLELLSLGDVPGAKFSWMLEGLDNSWSQPSGNRFVNYSNIPSGNYELKIRLYNSSLSQVIAERSMKLTIVPPFWKAWWFRLLLFAIVVAVIYFTMTYYIQKIRQQQTEEKIRFFTNTAHDIRTSLTLIKAPIEELTKDPNLMAASKHYLALASEQARRLSTVVTQLMDFQKMDIGKEQLVLRMVDIVGLIENRRQMFESFARSKNIRLQFTSDQECYHTAINETMMEKVVDNLISNAIKYSHPDSQVHIALKCTPEAWMLDVIDEGIGISKKAHHQLFREFYRGENAINSKIVGSGIGLLLVKNYVAMHGGEISCISQENAGSVFKVEIPFKEVYDESVVDIPSGEAASFIVTEVESTSLIQQEELTGQEMRILVVEDNDDLRNFMFHALRSDFEVLLADDGAEAWSIIQKQMPDLVVSDVMMPNMDGFELCRLMKSSYETSHIPVILLTALSGKAEQLQGLGLGADDYLTKPFDIAVLTQRIKTIVRNREIVKEKALKLIKSPVNDNEQILTNELNDKFLKKMLEVVRLNIEKTDFGKDEFATAMNVSGSLLYKKVKAITDQSPTDFIKTVRMDYALELLQSRKYNVTEVSELCGFSSIGYFGRVFKKHFGKSPTEV